MKQYKYRDFENPIIVDDDGKATYRGHEIEKYYHGYKTVGIGSGFSYNQLAKSHYIREMERIDERIRQEEYREAHKEEFENLETVEESLEYFFDMIGGWKHMYYLRELVGTTKSGNPKTKTHYKNKDYAIILPTAWYYLSCCKVQFTRDYTG